MDTQSLDRDSVDLEIQGHGKIAADSFLNSPKLQLQVKSIAMDKPTGNEFSFDLKMKNYNDLRERRQLPRLLVVYVMPMDRNDWLTHGEDGLICRQGAFWCNLLGMGESTNTTTQVVRVSTANHFSPVALQKIMRKASRFEDIGYDI